MPHGRSERVRLRTGALRYEDFGYCLLAVYITWYDREDEVEGGTVTKVKDAIDRMLKRGRHERWLIRRLDGTEFYL
jgi:hypothetical protein